MTLTDERKKELEGVLHEAEQTPIKVTGRNYWAKIGKLLVGKTVAKVTWQSLEDCEASGWYSRPPIITFTDGSWIMPMADDEGNNGGALHMSLTGDKEHDILPVF